MFQRSDSVLKSINGSYDTLAAIISSMIDMSVGSQHSLH